MECCPTAGIGALASQMGGQLLCLSGIKNVGVEDWAAGHLVDLKMSVLPPVLSTGCMAMNADLLGPGSTDFYLRGTTRERVPTTVVGLSSAGVCRHHVFLHMTKDISMTAPILPLMCFIMILATVSLPEKVCSKLVFDTSASARCACGGGTQCAEAPSQSGFSKCSVDSA